MNLYDEFIKRLIEVNDESKTDAEHARIESTFEGWTQGVADAIGRRFNGDYYYIEKIDAGEMTERPMCCGEFIDWKSKETK